MNKKFIIIERKNRNANITFFIIKKEIKMEKGYFYGMNKQAIVSIACKRPLLENSWNKKQQSNCLILGTLGKGMTFSTKIEELANKKGN